MRKTIVIAAALTVLSLPAFATQPPKPDPSGPVYNGGGGGGGGSAAAAAAASANAAAIAAQQQRQSQGQVQGQQQSSRNVNRNTAAGGAGGSSAATSGATGGSSSASSDQSINNSGAGSNSNNYQQSGIPVSSAVAPSFAIGGCQWAVSGGIQLFGAGVSGGGAGMYEFCKALMKSKHFIDQGNPSVAKALECQDSGIRAAYKTAGQPCQEDMPRVAANNTSPVVPVVASGRAPVCYAANGAIVPVGTRGAVRCENRGPITVAAPAYLGAVSAIDPEAEDERRQRTKSPQLAG